MRRAVVVTFLLLGLLLASAVLLDTQRLRPAEAGAAAPPVRLPSPSVTPQLSCSHYSPEVLSADTRTPTPVINETVQVDTEGALHTGQGRRGNQKR